MRWWLQFSTSPKSPSSSLSTSRFVASFWLTLSYSGWASLSLNIHRSVSRSGRKEGVVTVYPSAIEWDAQQCRRARFRYILHKGRYVHRVSNRDRAIQSQSNKGGRYHFAESPSSLNHPSAPLIRDSRCVWFTGQWSEVEREMRGLVLSLSSLASFRESSRVSDDDDNAMWRRRWCCWSTQTHNLCDGFAAVDLHFIPRTSQIQPHLILSSSLGTPHIASSGMCERAYIERLRDDSYKMAERVSFGWAFFFVLGLLCGLDSNLIFRLGGLAAG